MSYSSFDDVTRLTTSDQRHLLQHGDATERVWAAWSLGISLGSGSISDLVTSVHDSPAPGTRRHLLIILAGLGERTILQTFAEDDPDEYVRATAVQYLLRISRNTDAALHSFIRMRLLNDTSPIVKQAILIEAPIAFPAFEHQDLITLLEHPDVEIRGFVIDRLLATVPYILLFPGPLEERIAHEVDSSLRHRLLTLCLEYGGAVRLLVLCQRLDKERSLEILRLLHDTKQQFDWSNISSLARVGQPQYDAILILLLNVEISSETVEWFFSLIARSAQNLSARKLSKIEHAQAIQTSGWQAEQRLLAAFSQLEALGLANNREILDLVLAYLDDELLQFQWEQEQDEWDTDSDWYSTAIAEREQLRAVLRDIKAAT